MIVKLIPQAFEDNNTSKFLNYSITLKDYKFKVTNTIDYETYRLYECYVLNQPNFTDKTLFYLCETDVIAVENDEIIYEVEVTAQGETIEVEVAFSKEEYNELRADLLEYYLPHQLIKTEYKI